MLLRRRSLLLVAATIFSAHAEWYDHPDPDMAAEETAVGLTTTSYPSTRHRRLGIWAGTLEERYQDPAFSNELGKIRIAFDYDLLDTDVEQCREASESVCPSRVESNSGSCSKTYTCTEADVYNTEWKDLMEDHASWLDTFLDLTIENLEDPISLDENANYLDNYAWPADKTFDYSNTDLVIFMTMHKCADGVAGYASCKEYDERGRCLVGFFNWCPNQIDIENKDSPDVVQEDHYLFLHETLHVLGCCKPLNFVDADGNRQNSRAEYNTLVKTQTVFVVSLLKTNSICESVEQEDLGSYGTVGECGQACEDAAGCDYFIYGDTNQTTGECYWQQGLSFSSSCSTSTPFDESCCDGGLSSDSVFDFYSRHGTPKRVNRVVTPKVQQVAREQWDCPTIDGPEIEDYPLGSGSHWEARVMGGAVMAYGLLSGEAYLSDLTLAYLEDSGHYIAARSYPNSTCNRYGNGTGSCTDYTYSGGGRLLKATAVDFTQSIAASLFADGDTFDESAIDFKSPGYLRWGRHQGCNFIEQKASKVNWGERYFCDDPMEVGCTSDNRMSARCDIRTYGTASEANPVPSPFSCVADYSSSCDSTNANSNNPGLPEMNQYDVGECTTASCEAGYNSAFDHAPIRVGYWNCQDLQPSSLDNVVTVNGTNETIDTYTAISSLIDDLNQFGGQQHCETCRCFTSTLRAIGEIKSFDYTSYGLCYASNCYRKDYLQIGVRSRDGGTDWYGCPGNGGYLYLPGFSGSLYCPEATDYCLYEDITGKYYGETDLLLAWIALGVIIALPSMLIIYCCCFPNHAKPCVLRCKLCCGVKLARDERIYFARRLAIQREKKSQGLLRHLRHAEERLMTRTGSNLHMMTASEIHNGNHRTMTEEERTWAQKQVQPVRPTKAQRDAGATTKYVLSNRMQRMPVAKQYRGKEWTTEEDVMTAALEIRSKDPRIAGLAQAATTVLAKLGASTKGGKGMDKNLENTLQYYVEQDLASHDKKAVWCAHTINLIWIFTGLAIFVTALGTALNYGFWDGSENAAPFLYLLAVLVLLISCIGSYGSSYLRPSLTLLTYFYICCISIVYFVLAAVALFVFKDYVYSKMDTEWYSYRSFFPEKYHDLDRDEAIDQMHDDTSGYGQWVIAGFTLWTIFSLVAGAVCSVIIMTMESIVLNLFIGLNLLLLSLAICAMTLGIIAIKSGIFVLMPAISVGTSLFLIMLAIFGIYNDIHLSFRTVSSHVSFHRWMFDLYKYGAVPLALALYGGGVAIAMSKSWIKDELASLSDEDLSELADEFGQGGDKTELQEFMLGLMLFMGIILIAEGVSLTLMIPLMCYMDRLHERRETKLKEFEKDADFARRHKLLKKLPPDGFSIIPQLGKRRKQIRDLRKKSEAAEAKAGASSPAAGITMVEVGHGDTKTDTDIKESVTSNTGNPIHAVPTVKTGKPRRPSAPVPTVPQGASPHHSTGHKIQESGSGTFKL